MDDLRNPDLEGLKPDVPAAEGPEPAAETPQGGQPPAPEAAAPAEDLTPLAPPAPPIPPVPPTPPAPEPEAPRQTAYKRPFFSDTWEIFKRMFSSKFSRMLAVAATDSRGIWLPNLIVCLAAVLVGLLLLAVRLTSLAELFEYFSGYYLDFTGIGAGLVTGGTLSFAAVAYLLILAVKVLLNILKRPVRMKQAANVTSCVLLVPAAGVLAGGLVGLILPTLASICISVGSVASMLLLYVGVKHLAGSDTEPAWPYIWTMLVYELAASLAACILLVICIFPALLWYFL